MVFKKGKEWRGNAGGRPKGSGVAALFEAIKAVEKKRKINYFECLVERSLTEPAIATAILKKLIPDQVEIGQKPLLVMNE